jgi:hypothetical protein
MDNNMRGPPLHHHPPDQRGYSGSGSGSALSCRPPQPAALALFIGDPTPGGAGRPGATLSGGGRLQVGGGGRLESGGRTALKGLLYINNLMRYQ